jgi:hypothetical protein
MNEWNVPKCPVALRAQYLNAEAVAVLRAELSGPGGI